MKSGQESAVVKSEPSVSVDESLEGSRRGLRRTVHPQRRYSASPEPPPRKRFYQKTSDYSRRSSSSGKSKVWLFCEKFATEEGVPKAKCKLCNTILCHTGGSTRGILHHLRNRHGDETRDIINPPAQKRRETGETGIDIEDDDAWVQELDEDGEEEGGDSFSEKTKESSSMEDLEKKPKVVETEDDFNPLSGDEAPSYAGEVFLHEDGSYVTEDGDEFVDVVYVQEEEIEDELAKHDDDSAAYVASEIVAHGQRRNLAASPPHIPLPNSTPQQMSNRSQRKGNWKGIRGGTLNDEASAHYEMTEFGTPSMVMRAGGSRIPENFMFRDAKAMYAQSKTKKNDGKPLDVDEHFGQVVALSLKAMPVEHRAHARATILRCISDLTEQARQHQTFPNE